MANMYDISPLSYQPTTNMDWFTKALFGGKLIERGKIDIITGVKESTLLNLLDFSKSILQADGRDCAWTPEQVFKLSEKEVKIKTYKINLEQCLDDIERKRINIMLKPGAKNTDLPDSLEEATMEMLAKELSLEIETKIFKGDNSKDSNDFDGAVKVLTDSSEAIKVVGISLTKANVLDEIEKVYELIPEDVLAKGLENDSMCIYVSYDTLQRVKMSLSKVPNNNVIVYQSVTLESDIIKYLGVELVPVKGLDSSTMIAADISNFLLATDLLSDIEEIRLGQFPAPYDSKIFIDGRLRLGFVIPFEDEVVFYSKDNTVPQGFAAPMSTSIENTNDSKEFGYDGVSPIVNGIDQTPVHKLPLIKDLKATIAESTSIEDIQAIIYIESHTLRASKDLIATAEIKIKELEGGE